MSFLLVEERNRTLYNLGLAVGRPSAGVSPWLPLIFSPAVLISCLCFPGYRHSGNHWHC